MKHVALLLLIPILLLACNQKASNSASQDQSNENVDTSNTSVTPAAPAPLFESKKLHAFSDKAKQDTFILTVDDKGDGDWLKAQVNFKIISHEGKEIYRDTFDSNFLIDYGILELADDPAKLTDQMRADYIKKRLQSFFDEKNFRSPAIKPGAEFEEYHKSKELFDELKQNENSVSFFYLLGKEDGKYIAYSAKSGKAQLFYNCC